jgi:hypothetical protein
VTDINQCLVHQLKNIVISHGGTCTEDGKNMNKKQLKRCAMAHLRLEKENPLHTQVFNRSKDNYNGTFINIDTSERRSVPQIIDELIRVGECKPHLQNLFINIQTLIQDDKVIDDFNTIVMEAPEMEEDFIVSAFAHVGDNSTQKNIVRGLERCLQANTLLYHAMAWAPDKKSIYLISKQRASQARDEKTSTPTEKDNFEEYLTMAQVSVDPTTIESHGHSLGVFRNVMRKFCVRCKAGCMDIAIILQQCFIHSVCIGAMPGLQQSLLPLIGVFGCLVVKLQNALHL